MQKSKLTNFPSYMQRYINLVDENDHMLALRNSLNEAQELLIQIDRTKYDFAYEPGKWTVKEVILHCIDTERIFQYRSLCIARGEKADLPGFDQDDYAKSAKQNNRSYLALVNELVDVRKSTISLFDGLNENQISTVGKANGIDIQPVAYAYLSAGHLKHHLNVLKERYL